MTRQLRSYAAYLAPVTVDTSTFHSFGGDGRTLTFANYSEYEVARILDYYELGWLYEPTRFVLARHEDGTVAEAFTPDFYLPEQDLYLELTVMKQSLVTRKNRKLRRLK